MIVLGLTGGIGMGKSTTAEFFREEGAEIWDADASVHRLYAKGGAAVEPLKQAFGDEIIVDAAVDRPKLAAVLGRDSIKFQMLEQIVHPLVLQDRMAVLESARAKGVSLFVVDIPLLFETGGDAYVDAVVVCSAPAEIQRLRVLSRPGATQERFDAIVARQMLDAEKRKRADFIVETGEGLEAARETVKSIVETVTSSNWVSPRRPLSSDSGTGQ